MSRARELWEQRQKEKRGTTVGASSSVQNISSSPSTTVTTGSRARELWEQRQQEMEGKENRYQSIFDRYNKLINTAKGMDQYYNTYRTEEERKAYRSDYRDMEGLQQEINDLIDGFDAMPRDLGSNLLAGLNSISTALSKYDEYYGQWDSQEAYDAFLAEQREIQAKRNLNLSDYQTQIDRKMQTLQRFQNQQGKSGGNQEKIQALEDEIQDMVVYQRQAEFLQRRDRLEAVTESPDFAQGSQYTQEGDDRILYDYINNPDGYRDQYNQDRERLNLLARNPDLQYGGFADAAGLEDGSEDPFLLKGYDLLTDEEIAVYNYYYSTQGSEAARNYLETIQEDLNYRVAINRFQQGYQGNTANGLLYGIEAGVNQAQTGLVNALDAVTGKSDYIPLSSKQILSSLVRDDLAESGWRMPDALGGASLGQAAYDLITTSANMAPSILTSLAVNYIAPGWGSAVGAAMMAGSAAGNAYQEALNAGYGKDRARTYAQLIGTAEGALQYVLGGINALGGKVSGNAIAKALSKVENGLLRAAGQIGGNMLSEGTEEAIQEVLDPIFRNIVLGTDEDVDWGQVAYSGVLGAVTGGVFEGTGMLLNQNANTRSRASRDAQIPGQSALGTDTSTPGPTPGGMNVEQDTVNTQQAGAPTFQDTVVPDVNPEQDIRLAPEEVETAAPEPVSVPESGAEVEESVQPSKSISEVAQQYGNQAGAVEQIYRLGPEGQSIDTFEREFGLAYDMGKSGVSESYAMQSQGTQSLTEQQRQFAFQTGQAAAQALAKTQASQNQAAANGKTGWRKGVVKGEGVSIADLTQTFNDPQRTAYKALSTIAEATGIDIVLYKSQTDANGNFQGAQGKFKWSENAIYIDVNAGLSNVKDVGELSKYTMLRTFDHEFTHFIEKWNPEQYNEFRSTVFDALTEQGENVEDLIDMKLAQDSGGTMTYDMAAREVVAEAMTDILPDSNFVERLASQNRTLFETLLSKIKEFLANVKSYFSKLAGNTSREAKALKKQMGDTVSYLENIVKMFDDAAVKAVETYQATVAEDTQVEKKAETVEAKPKQETKQAEKPKAPAVQETQAPEYRSSHGFTIRTNAQYGSLEISFDGKPDASIRDVLKDHKFRWNSKMGVWYGKAEQQTIVDSLNAAYEKLGQTETAAKAVEMPAASVGEVGEAMVTEVLQENSVATEEAHENTVDGVDTIPAKAETEEAKRELKKAVRMPIEGTNTEAILEGIKNHELSMDSITLRGNVPGFNVEQRTYLAEKLIEGVYSNKESIKIDVPYDGKFEIVNTPESVAKVLEELKVRVNQEVLLDKRALTLLNSKNNLRYTTIDGQVYLSNGAMMIPSSNAAVDYVKEHYGAKEGNISSSVLDRMKKAGMMIEKAPTEAVTDKKLTVYIFDINGKKQYYDKRYVSYFDGNKFYAVGGDSLFPLLKVVDSTGEVKGFIAGIHTEEYKIHGEKPSKLKSFAQKKVSPAERQTSDTTVTRNKGTDKPTNAAVQLPKMDSSSNVQTVESSVKLEDFGEKIGGARKDLWNSRGLLVDDLSQMNDRERSKVVKKDNVWKRPDYRKLVEGGESRGILYARNEIRKALNQNITYPYSTGGGTQSPQYLERVRALQEDFISTVRDIQKLAEQAKSAEDFQNMGRPWLKEHGFLTETNGRDHYTEKWRKNPALKGTDYVITVEYLARNFGKLDALAEKKGFAADAKTQVPKGYSIHQDTLEDGTWFVAKGAYILRHHIPSYEDALTFLKQLSETRKRKTRFVPQQLLEVHRKGPDYRSSKNVSGQDYLDTFGFRGGEFGNWLNEKDRQVSLNYGFDALKDLADALQIADGDISLGGNLSIAFGARGQGLSGAAAHYEPERHVINLTKMKGAGSLAHEWFHALDDYVGGYQEKMATDNQRNLPETTKAAVRKLITTMQYRDATQEETDLAASKRYEQARRSVTYQVGEMFRWVEKLESGRLTEDETKYFARKPTMEDAQKYHALLNRLLDTGDAAVIEELSDFRKGIYGRVIPKENREAIGYRLFPLKPDANKNVQKMRQYTDFYTNSRRFNDLYQKDGDYWDSTVEMAARAFACYVADKTGANNDYLSAHSDSAVGFDVAKNGDLTVIKAFPEGQERTDINAAFEQLIAALKDDGFLHVQERTEKPGMIQYQDRKQMEKGDHYGEGNEGRRAGSRQTDSPGLARGEDSGFGGQSLGSVSAGNQWEGIGAEQRSQIINQLDLYTYDNPESEFYLRLFEDGDLSDLDVHMNAISNMAEQFYEAIQGNRILLENDPRFRWLGDSLSLFVQDVENILSGNFTPVTDEEFQARTHTFSDREILEIAADDLRLDELTEGERDALRIFRDRLARFSDLQDQRSELRKLYMEQQFGANGAKVDRAEAEKTRNRMQVLDSQIEKARSGVLDVENKAVLRRVLQSARKVVEQKQKDADTATLRRWRDRRNNAEAIKKYRNRIAKDVKSMTDWVINPSNKDILRHIPDALKNSVIPFLTSIDFTSKRQLRGGEATQADQAFLKRLDILRSTLKNRLSDDYTGMYSGYTDLPPQFMERLDGFVNSVKEIARENSGEFIINRMTASELKDLSDVVRGLKKLIQDCNRFHANAMFQHVYEAGDSTISELGQIGKAPSRTKTGESFHNFVFWEQIRPTYAFERFGKGGMAIYDGLRRGQSQRAFDAKEILAFSEKAYTEAEVKQWEKETLEIGLEDGTVRMKVSQAMSFYELSKRKQALGHILGQGIRVATYYHGKEKISDTGHRLTMDDVSSIIDRLTPRQKEVADQLQKFMQEKGGQWGNFVSVKRFGENLFGEPNYFPINSDGRHLEATADENPSAASLYALLNMGFTKQTREKANNRLILYSIFDVFANHMASMAQYHSMALPVLDALKWFNYRQETSTGEIVGVRDELNRVFGAPEESRPGSGKRGYAENFVIGILKAFNGTEEQGVPSDARGLNALRRFNMAQVAYNFRVVIQQPLAITRAAMILDYGSIVKGMKLNPSQIRENIRQMQTYSGIAVWKSLGFYDTNISRGLTSLIKHSDTAFEKIGEVGMLGAEKADEITWAAIWSACKEEIRKKQPKFTPGSEAFFQAVTELFEEVVYKTQVVDSILTKNAYLRSKGLFARFTGSFMSESTTNASMLVDAFDKYRMDLQRGNTKTQAWEKNRKNIVRTAYVYAVGALILAGVQAIADAFRDDDDYATFLEKWLDAFQGNLIDELMPFNKLPIMSDFYEVAKELSRILGMDTYGNPPQSVYMQWYDSLVNGAEILYQKITGEETNYTWYAGAYKLLQAVSGIVGLPMAAATREIVTAWNSTIGAMSPRLKVKTYDAGDMANIKYAFLDGYLTQEEAQEELLSNGLVDNEDEAYWKIQEWSAEGEYSRYDRLFDAIRNGQSTQEAMEELTSHGYEEKDVRSRVKIQIGQWYQNGEITKQQAIDMMEKHLDMDSEDILSQVNRWSSKVVTGIAFEDIKEEFLAGNITASRAIDMYVLYGGYTKEDARATVQYWDFKNRYPDVYADDAWFDAYYEKIQSSGIPIKTYMEYRNQVREITGEGKKERRMAVIDSLPITNAQKDALYYGEGWAESTIDEAPWH